MANASIPISTAPYDDTLPQSRRPLVPLAVRVINDISLVVHGRRPRACAPSIDAAAPRDLALSIGGPYVEVLTAYLHRTADDRRVVIAVSGLCDFPFGATLALSATFSEFDGTSADAHTATCTSIAESSQVDTGGVDLDAIRDAMRPLSRSGTGYGLPTFWTFAMLPNAGLTVASTKLVAKLRVDAGSVSRITSVALLEEPLDTAP